MGLVDLQYEDPLLNEVPLIETMTFPVRWDTKGEPLFFDQGAGRYEWRGNQ